MTASDTSTSVAAAVANCPQAILFRSCFSVARAGSMTHPHWSEDTDWQRLSDVVDRLKRKVERAIYERDEHNGQEAHSDLLDAEWRLRQAERRRARG